MSSTFEQMKIATPNSLEIQYKNRGLDMFYVGEGKLRMFSIPHISVYLHKTHHVITMSDNDEMYTYHKELKTYLPGGDKLLRTKLNEMLGLMFNERYVKQILYFIRGLSTRDRKDYTLPLNKIPVGNGILLLPINKYHGWDHTGKIELEENSPENFVFSRIPTHYDPEAQCPEWLRFINKVLGTPEQVVVLQEYFGYALFRDFHIHKALMLVGQTRTGRSTTLYTLRALLGENNCSAVGLQDLKDKFERVRIYNKLANIVPEQLSEKTIKDTAHFNKLTGQDPVPARRLYQMGFEFVPYNIWAFAANRLPPVYQDEPAFFIRWILLTYTGKQYFPYDPETDTTLKTKFTLEMSGILNWALVGLRRVLLNGGFTYYKTAEEIKTLWWQMSDMLGAFMYSNSVVLGPTEQCTKDEFQEAYEAFCLLKNIPALPKANVGREMNRRFKETVNTGSRMIQGIKIYCWNGVGIRNVEIEPPEDRYINQLFEERQEIGSI